MEAHELQNNRTASRILSGVLAQLAAADPAALLSAARRALRPAEVVACCLEVLDASGVRRISAPDSATPHRLVELAAAARRRRALAVEADGEVSFCALPLMVAGRPLGTLALAVVAPEVPHDALRRLGEAVATLSEASDTGVAAIAEALQAALLPSALPMGEWFDLAALYVPSGAHLQVGGDWYDAQILDDGTLAVSVGDVAGHGPEAAARMGELRSATTALRLVRRAPGDLIAVLHRLAQRTGHFATAICARLDPTGQLVWASAGHLPPILISQKDGTAPLVDVHSPPLGVGFVGEVATNHRRLAPGDVLLLYTDGLIERRGVPLDESIELLSKVAATGSDGSPAELMEHLVEHFAGSGQALDDIAVVAVRWLGPPPSNRRGLGGQVPPTLGT